MVAWSELTFFLIILTALTPLLGGYMAAVFEGELNGVRRFGAPVEALVYRMCRIRIVR